MILWWIELFIFQVKSLISAMGLQKHLEGFLLHKWSPTFSKYKYKDQKNLNNLTISLPKQFIHFDLIEPQVASHLILALTH